MTKDTIAIEPIELLKWVRDLGVQEMSLERLTGNGNALLHPEIFPTNLEQDQWFLKMHEQIVEHDARHWFENEFMETIYNKFETGFLKVVLSVEIVKRNYIQLMQTEHYLVVQMQLPKSNLVI